MPQPRARGPHQHLQPGPRAGTGGSVGGDRWDASIIVQVIWQGRGGSGAQWWCLQQHLLDTDLLQDGGSSEGEEVDHGMLGAGTVSGEGPQQAGPSATSRKECPPHLDEEPGGDECQAAVLPIEAIVVGVGRQSVQVEEPARGTVRCCPPSCLHPRPHGPVPTEASAACWCWCGSRWHHTGQPATR